MAIYEEYILTAKNAKGAKGFSKEVCRQAGRSVVAYLRPTRQTTDNIYLMLRSQRITEVIEEDYRLI